MATREQSAVLVNLFDLTGQVALVTGGSGRVGRQLSRALAQAGATVVVASRNVKRCQDFAAQLEEDGHKAIAVCLDVADEASVTEAMNVIVERLGRLDVLVNNAGVATNIAVEKLEVEEFERIMRVNVTGTFVCSKVFFTLIKDAGKGNIINISSIYGVVAADQRIYGDSGRNSSLPYAASKAAIIQMTRYLAVCWANRGIRVNVISPGGVFNNQEPEFLARYNSRTPLNRMASSVDLVGAVVFLASDASSYITGHNLVVDGGWTAW